MPSLSSSSSEHDIGAPSDDLNLSELTHNEKLLSDLADLLKARPSFSHGIMKLTSQFSTLFYGSGSNLGRIDMSNATESELEHLSDVCGAATFGRNQQDVLDESYRKARKLDRSDFACHFDAEHCGLVKTACREIFVGKESSRAVKAELYKLNVYGPGSFFKPHQDTPRGKNMFGSLVVVFPTAHEGGDLVLRPRDAEETTVLDFGALLSKEEPSIGYAAFFSDVTHEVYEVKSGYRVTLTYNLYFNDPVQGDSLESKTTLLASDIAEAPIAKSLINILTEPTFLPDGGLIGFGLRYQYALDLDTSSIEAQKILPALKGSDSAILRALSQQGLKPFPMAIYKTDDTTIMCDNFVRGLVGDPERNLCSLLLQDHWGNLIDKGEHADWPEDLVVDEQVTWITKPTYLNTYSADYATYGNEPMLETAYADLALMVMVGKPGERAVVRKIVRKNDRC